MVRHTIPWTRNKHLKTEQKCQDKQTIQRNNRSFNSSSSDSISNDRDHQIDTRDEIDYFLRATTARKLNKSASSAAIPKKVDTSLAQSGNEKNASNWSCYSSIDDNMSTSRLSISSSPAVVERVSDNVNRHEGSELIEYDANKDKSCSNSVISSKSNLKFIFLKKSSSLKKLRSFSRISMFRRSKKSSASASSTHNDKLDLANDKFFNGGISVLSLKSKMTHRSNADASHRSRRSHVSRTKFSILSKAPSAKDAAFGGPPRYDWIDIESAAAIKIQALFRRILTINKLEEKRIVTSYMQRTRNIERKTFMKIASSNKRQDQDYPSSHFLFSLCSALDQYMLNSVYSFDKHRNKMNQDYQRKKKIKEMEEATKRKYHHLLNTKPSLQVLEEYEVLDVKRS